MASRGRLPDCRLHLTQKLTEKIILLSSNGHGGVGIDTGPPGETLAAERLASAATLKTSLGLDFIERGANLISA